MKAKDRHLNDEHMRLYEWNGLGTAVAVALPERSKRTHAWHASYGVLAVLTSLLILNGCDSPRPAERRGDKLEPLGKARAAAESEKKAGSIRPRPDSIVSADQNR